MIPKRCVLIPLIISLVLGLWHIIVQPGVSAWSGYAATYRLFSHISTSHLLSNLSFVFIFGIPVVSFVGWRLSVILIVGLILVSSGLYMRIDNIIGFSPVVAGLAGSGMIFFIASNDKTIIESSMGLAFFIYFLRLWFDVLALVGLITPVRESLSILAIPEYYTIETSVVHTAGLCSGVVIAAILLLLKDSEWICG